MDFEKLKKDLDIDPQLLEHLKALSSYVERIYPGAYALVLWSQTSNHERYELATKLGFGSYENFHEHITQARTYLVQMSLEDHFAIAKEQGIVDAKEMLKQLLPLFD